MKYLDKLAISRLKEALVGYSNEINTMTSGKEEQPVTYADLNAACQQTFYLVESVINELGKA